MSQNNYLLLLLLIFFLALQIPENSRDWVTQFFPLILMSGTCRVTAGDSERINERTKESENANKTGNHPNDGEPFAG